MKTVYVFDIFEFVNNLIEVHWIFHRIKWIANKIGLKKKISMCRTCQTIYFLLRNRVHIVFIGFIFQWIFRRFRLFDVVIQSMCGTGTKFFHATHFMLHKIARTKFCFDIKYGSNLTTYFRATMSLYHLRNNFTLYFIRICLKAKFSEADEATQ